MRTVKARDPQRICACGQCLDPKNNSREVLSIFLAQWDIKLFFIE